MAGNDRLSIENAQIMFRNFEGREERYNAKGNKNFCVVLDEKTAQQLFEDGWNVKELPPREEGDDSKYILNVKVSYKYERYAPKVVIYAGGVPTVLNDETIGELDYADIESVDVIIRPRHWEMKGEEGIKAYLSVMYVTVEEDIFAKKYEKKYGSAR